MRFIYLGIGWSCVGLGAVGVVLPVLPTTPFLLVAAACFARSSRCSRIWLLRSPVLGPVLRGYLRHRVVPARAKATALVLLWPSVAWTATQAVPVPAVGVALLVIAIAVSGYVLSLPSKPSTFPLTDS